MTITLPDKLAEEIASESPAFARFLVQIVSASAPKPSVQAILAEMQSSGAGSGGKIGLIKWLRGQYLDDVGAIHRAAVVEVIELDVDESPSGCNTLTLVTAKKFVEKHCP